LSEGSSLETFATALVRDRRIRSNLYGFFDPENPVEYGYANPPNVPALYSEVADPSVEPELLTKCGDEAEQHSNGLSLTMESSLLPNEGPPTPVSDSRYVSVVNDWSACMKTRGFTYADPLSAIADERWRFELSGPSSAQKATAAADIACKQQTNLVAKAAAIQAAYDQAYITSHRAELAAVSAGYAFKR
jgi:hypothetical protein